MNRNRKFLIGLALGLFLLAPPGIAEGDENQVEASAWAVYVNGSRNTVNSLTANGQDWFDAQQLAAALGHRLQHQSGTLYVNGQLLQQPIVLLAGNPYTTAEAMARTLGATVQRDSARKIVYLNLAQDNNGGLPYYSADYITPEEQHKRQRATSLATSDGNRELEEFDERAAREWETRYKHIPYTPMASTLQTPMLDTKEAHHGGTIEDWYNQMDQPGRPHAKPTNYVTRQADNGVFRMILTDAKVAEVLKGMQPPLYPQPGHKFVVLNLSLENVSKQEQRPGWFNVRDQNGTPYPANSLYSKLPQSVMRSREVSTGFLIFEIPMSAQPVALEATVTPALSLSLIYR